MNEERFAYHLRQRLNRSLDDVPVGVLRRLEASRHHALAHQKLGICAAVLVPAGGIEKHDLLGDFALRQILGVLVLLLGIFFAFYWQGHQYVRDLEDIDSALLSDDIPLDAFLDKGYAAWLEKSSEE